MRRLCLVVTMVMLACVSIQASAQSTSPTLNAAVVDLGWPWGYAEDGEIKGMVVDMFRVLEKYSGVTMHLTLLPYPRMLQYMKEGKQDISLTIRILDDTEVAYVDTIFHLNSIAVGLKGNTINAYEDLYKLRVGSVRGGNYYKRYDHDDKVKKTLVKQYKQLLPLLVKKRIDAAVAFKITLMSLAVQQNLSKKIDFKNALQLGAKPVWIFVSKDGKGMPWVPKIKTAIVALKKHDEIRKIFQSYLGELERYVDY